MTTLILLAGAAVRVPEPYRTPVVLFDDPVTIEGLKQLASLGAERYILVYQNNCDPNAQRTGEIDPEKVMAWVLQSEGNQPEGWGVLDFESPFDEWILKGPDSPQRQKAVDSMVKAILRLKELFPQVRWTYYGIPALSYYLNGQNWSDASDASKQTEIKRQLQSYGPVLDACDWLAPCIYITVGDATRGGIPNPLQRLGTRTWVEARTRMCVDHVRSRGRDVPVIPFVSPMYMPGGAARAFSVIAPDVLLADAIRPAMKGGASGVTIWTSASLFIRRATGQVPGADFTEGGGSEILVKHWAEDLGRSVAEIQSPAAVDMLKEMMTKATVGCAKESVEAWKAMHPPVQGDSGRSDRP